MKDVMLDLETLGTKPGCIVLSVGAVAFGPDRLGDEFYAVLNVEQQEAEGLTRDPATCAWWEKQSKKARRIFSEPQIDLGEALTDFSTFCARLGAPSKIRMWGNGSDFDNPILQAVYEAASRKQPWGTYRNRCYRTLKGLAPSVGLVRGGTHHNALDDAKTQAAHAVRILHDLGLWVGLLQT
jgi:exodeoxyribonuclease VIII